MWPFGLLPCGLMFVALVWIYGAEKFRRDVVNDVRQFSLLYWTTLASGVCVIKNFKMQYSLEDWTLPRIWKYAIR